MFVVASVLGPNFSNQVWSVIWDAKVWPRVRFVLGIIRCIIEGKNPSILEKW